MEYSVFEYWEGLCLALAITFITEVHKIAVMASASFVFLPIKRSSFFISLIFRQKDGMSGTKGLWKKVKRQTVHLYTFPPPKLKIILYFTLLPPVLVLMAKVIERLFEYCTRKSSQNPSGKKRTEALLSNDPFETPRLSYANPEKKKKLLPKVLFDNPPPSTKTAPMCILY